MRGSASVSDQLREHPTLRDGQGGEGRTATEERKSFGEQGILAPSREGG